MMEDSPRLYLRIDESLRPKPVRYVFNFFASVWGIRIYPWREGVVKEKDVLLWYGSEKSGDQRCVFIQSSGFFTDEYYLKKSSMACGLAEFEQVQYLKLPGQGELRGLPDFIASAFYLLTSYEEFVECGTRDWRHRREFSSTLFSRYAILKKPMIDLIIRKLQSAILEISPELVFNKMKWVDKSFGLVITHDIDSLHSLKRFRLIPFLRAVKKHEIGRYLQSVAHRIDPHHNLEEIYRWEKSVGIVSSNYFIPSEAEGDADYSMEEIAQSPTVQQMVRDGWEVGFHPGAATYQDRLRFEQEKQKLEKTLQISVKGGRQHGLRFTNPHTWRLWNDNGLDYDSTVGFAEYEGFKAGTCYPYPVFDIIEEKAMHLVEMPLTLMDCTLDKYRHLSLEEMRTVIFGLLEEVKKSGGLFMLLWHNTYFGERNKGAYHKLLIEFIGEAMNQGAHVGTASSFCTLWKERSQLYSIIPS